MKPKPKFDYTTLPVWIVDDIRDYLEENPDHKPPTTEHQVVHYYLAWNGITGYTYALITLFEALGWKGRTK